MDTNISHGSATIYQFPTNGRAGSGSSHDMPEMRSPSIASTEFGSGWYHDAAIRDTDGRATAFGKSANTKSASLMTAKPMTDAVILQMRFPQQ